MSKSRGDRGKTPAQAPPPQAVVLNEVIPGRLTEQDWGLMVDDETSEDFVTDILDDIVDIALDSIFQKILESRLIPYSVDAARVMLLDLVEWQFLERDMGEVDPDNDPSWIEEEEPRPGIIDSWAQGAVPVIVEEDTVSPSEQLVESDNEKTSASPEDLVDLNAGEIESEQESDIMVESDCELQDEVKEELGIRDKEEEEEILGEDQLDVRKRNETFIRPKPPKSEPPKQRKKVPRYRGKVPEFRPITLTPVTDSKASMSQNQNSLSSVPNALDDSNKPQYGRPPGTKEVTFDDKGNVVMVQKLKVEKLPSHRVKTHYAIVDPVEEDMKAKLLNKKQRYTILKHPREKKQDKSVISDSNKNFANTGKSNFQAATLPTPLVDLMNVSKGVCVNEGGILKKGTSKATKRYEPALERLKPVSSQAYGLPLNPRDIICGRSPVVRPMDITTKPLPAIRPGSGTTA